MNKIIKWLKSIYSDNRKAVIAISGGVDSAVALTLLVRAIGKERIIPILLPYGQQKMEDARLIVKWNGLENYAEEINIKPMVDVVVEELGINGEPVRKGNVIARTRMIILFDYAKRNGALVCGTENKSEHYLGYFTRFGDAASDVEPIADLYKTEVWEMAKVLGLPEIFSTKAPSAELWEGQTDEKELGFSYQEADSVLRLLVDKKMSIEEIEKIIKPELVERVMKVVRKNEFKRKVPYELKV